MKELEAALKTLPLRSQVAFAAAVAERAVQEGAKFSDRAKQPLLRQALDLAWQYAGGAPLDYQRDLASVHHKVADSVPDIDEPGADEVYAQVASAVARMLYVLEDPERSAHSAASAAASALGLMSLVYKDYEKAEAGEDAWQHQALELIKAAGAEPPSRDAFSKIPDFERGPVYEPFQKR
jgi:hypothetical protein